MNRPAQENAGVCPRLLMMLAVFALVSIPGLWLADHLYPRSEYFVQRRGVLVSAEVRPDHAPVSAFLSETVHITADTGLTVDLRVLRPARQTRPLPLVVLLGGHRTGRNAIEVVGDPGELVVAALDYPYHGPEKVRGWRQAIAAVPLIQRGLLDTPPAILLAVDWLEGQPWVARQQIEIVGVSLGAPFAAAAGALDKRFRRVWIIHGGADNRGWIEHNLRDRVKNDWLRAQAATLVYLLAYGRSFDTAKWVGCIAPRPLIVIGAKNDERLPQSMVERLYAAAGEPKELIWTEGGHINPDRPEIVRQLLEIVRSRIGG
jgi:dienelactone hydrolase